MLFLENIKLEENVVKIIDKKQLAPAIVKFLVEAPLIAKKAQPGHFIILRYQENGERIPLTIADFDREKGTITLVCQGIGKSTEEINQLPIGASFLDLLGPLGQPYPIKKLGTVVCVAGGLGVAPLYPKAKALHEAGNKVISLIGAQRKEMLIMTEEMAAVSAELQFSTDDGSFGYHGFITDPLRAVLTREKVDEVVAVGPVPMMASAVKVAKEFQVPVVVSLNALMVDGTGMCGGCRVTVGGETKFCCVDGPTFDGAAVDFKELMMRQRYYRDQEQEAVHCCKSCKLEEVGK
ncbi:MAG TPA: sulfide/dihydroorotate dehydrogenase-like FAD/NAD-binding protein [Firmicutes bacterium]|jgi:ferredoxin--NADP+ reductase|nr:sulfide/dihydroorotate dehydrogenase-like FAD/NAD-binding protein [Bacillota bacterium]